MGHRLAQLVETRERLRGTFALFYILLVRFQGVGSMLPAEKSLPISPRSSNLTQRLLVFSLDCCKIGFRVLKGAAHQIYGKKEIVVFFEDFEEEKQENLMKLPTCQQNGRELSQIAKTTFDG